MIVAQRDGRWFGWLYQSQAWLDLESTDAKRGVAKYSFIVHSHQGKEMVFVASFEGQRDEIRNAPVVTFDDLVPDNRPLQLFLAKKHLTEARAERAARAA